jgi:hypothetical protein
MGLDLVEFAMAVENAFGLYLPEADAADLATPGLLVDYLMKRLPPADTGQCLDQIAFYRIRKAAMQVLGAPRGAIRPETPWASVVPDEARRRQWGLIQHASGLPAWPKLSMWRSFSGDAETVGKTSRFIATRCPGALKGAGGPWTRAEVEEVIRRLMADQLGIAHFDWNDHFVRDLRLE